MRVEEVGDKVFLLDDVEYESSDLHKMISGQFMKQFAIEHMDEAEIVEEE